MKKIKITCFLALTPMFLTGCVPINLLIKDKNIENESTLETPIVEELEGNSTINKKPSVEGETVIEDSKNKTHITIEDIEVVDFLIKEPDSIGTVYMQCKFKNNSDKPLTSVTFEYRIGDDTTFLSTYDTILPGETSAIVEGFGPESRNPDDVELIYASYEVYENGSSVEITYDAKLDRYDVREY